MIESLRRFFVISVTVWLALGLYFLIDRWHFIHRFPVAMPSWVPFWPGFAVPYLGMLLVTWFLPLAIRDAARFRACLRAFVCAFLLIVPWWILTPTTLSRPPLPDGPAFVFYRWIAEIDPPNNIIPAAHGVGPVVAAWFVGLERPSWRWPLALMLLGGLSSIPLIWQHRPLDVLLGTVAAGVGIAIGERLHRVEQAQLQRSIIPIAASLPKSRFTE